MAWGNYGYRRGFWRPYVPVWQRRQQAEKKAKGLARKGRLVEPVEIEGREIAWTFWGRSWCENLERFSDFENRLPRGRTYVRNGSVIDLQIARGKITALVSGSRIYNVSVALTALARKRWAAIKRACGGRIDSVVELLQGKFSRGVMEVLTDRDTGLFPAPRDIQMECSCPDWATMCKHVAAVLYGVGARLDSRPELLFVLRGVDQSELVTAAAAGAALVGAGASAEAMDSGQMEKLFKIEIDPEAAPARRRRNSPSQAQPEAVPLAPGPGRGRRPPSGGAGRSAGLRRLPVRKERPIEVRLPLMKRHFLRRFAITNSEYRRLFSVSVEVAYRELTQLTRERILIRRGLKRGTHYVLSGGDG